MPAPSPLTKAHDGARILWRWFTAADDTRANEGVVREFDAKGDYVRVASSIFKDDAGEWLRAGDMRVVAVLEERVELIARPRRPREEGDEWKDAT